MIPDGWSKVAVKDIAKVLRGASPRPKGDPRYYGGNVPRLMGADVTRDGKYVTPRIDFLTQEGAKISRPMTKGSLVIVCSGTVGVPAILEVDCCIHDGFLALYDISNSCNIDYLYEIFSFMQSIFFASATHGGVFTNLTTEILRDFNFLLPPFSEQCKIAEVLGVWDESIDLLEKLIGKTRSRKQGLMQQLLTGKKRFKEFEGSEWRTVKLIEVAEVIVSPVDKLTVEGEISVLLCNYTHVYHNIRITKALNFMIATATEKEIAKFSLRKGDVVITKDSETPNDIAIPAYVSEDLGNVVCGYHLSILRPRENEIDGEYLSYLLSISEIKYYFFTLANGATRFGLSVGSIEKAQFNLPSLPEQVKIAAVLSATDEEISTLEKQLAAYKQQKLGLMQQLLTGRIRIFRI